uniref:Uncharacterized protein n=1 Tax=Oryza meridionalis TaxID=40149 RepID=A0A0E0FBB2_9ORYZ
MKREETPTALEAERAGPDSARSLESEEADVAEKAAMSMEADGDGGGSEVGESGGSGEGDTGGGDGRRRTRRRGRGRRTATEGAEKAARAREAPTLEREETPGRATEAAREMDGKGGGDGGEWRRDEVR